MEQPLPSVTSSNNGTRKYNRSSPTSNRAQRSGTGGDDSSRARWIVELQLVQLGENSYPGSSPRRTCSGLREATNPSTERRTATCNLLLVEQNSYRSPSHSVTYIRHPSSYYSANCAWNSPSQASRRPTTAPPSTTDRHRPPSHRAQRSGTGWEDSSRACWVHVQCNYIKSEITPLHTLLWHYACSSSSCSHQPSSVIPRRSNVPVALRTSIRSSLCPPSPFTPSPFTAALHSAARHPSFRRSSPFTPPPFTPALHSPPFTPPPFTPALHCAALHPSFCRSSPFTHLPSTLPSRPSPPPRQLSIRRPSPRPSLRRSSPLVLPLFTLHSSTVYSSLPPFTPPPPPPPFDTPPVSPHFTTPRSTINPVAFHRHPSLRCPSLPPFTPPPGILHSGALHHHSSTHHASTLRFLPSLPALHSRLHCAALRPSLRRPSLRRPSLPPFIPPHRQPPFVEHQLVQLGENSYPGSSPRRAAVAIREATNPSTERRTATRNHLLVEQNSYRSPSHSVTYIRHPSSYYSANCAWNSPSQASRRPPTAPPSTPTSSHPITFN
jgi:hypothetical protein